mgnify:CR=1 FL=1
MVKAVNMDESPNTLGNPPKEVKSTEVSISNPDDDVDIWKVYHNLGVSPASTDHTFFMIVGPEFGEYNFQTKTYAVMLDFNQDGTYDKVYINDPASDYDRFGTHTWDGSAWSTSPTEDGSDNHVEEGFPRWSGTRHDIVKFAIDDDDFNSGDDNEFDYKVVTIDDDDSPFSSSEAWASINSTRSLPTAPYPRRILPAIPHIVGHPSMLCPNIKAL